MASKEMELKWGNSHSDVVSCILSYRVEGKSQGYGNADFGAFHKLAIIPVFKKAIFSCLNMCFACIML